MDAIRWFVNEYQKRFSFLTTELGFDPPLVEEGGFWAGLTYPHGDFAVSFSLDARDTYVDCTLLLWQGDQAYFSIHIDARVPLEEVIRRLGLSFEEKMGQPMSDLDVVAKTDYYERVWRAYGAKIVQWAETFFAEGEEAFYRNLSPLDLVGYIRKARPQDKVSCRTFEQMVERHFGFLRQYGFQRFPALEQLNDERLCTVVFAGKHIGFMIMVDQPIVPKKDGTFQLSVLVNVVRLGDYDQRSLVSYLERQAGVEAFCSELRVAESVSPVEREVARWAELLKRYGQRLLADREDSWEVG